MLAERAGRWSADVKLHSREWFIEQKRIAHEDMEKMRAAFPVWFNEDGSAIVATLTFPQPPGLPLRHQNSRPTK